MKKIFFIVIAIISVITLFAFVAFGVNEYKDYPEKVSSDGKYSYFIVDDGIWFKGSLETRLTVLNIPESIDGQKVTGIRRCISNSNCLTKINFPKSIKSVSQAFPFYSISEFSLPLCNIGFNNGVTLFDTWAFSHSIVDNRYEVKNQFKVLVFPESVNRIKRSGFQLTDADNIVVYSNPITSPESMRDLKNLYRDLDKENCKPVNIYFTGNATNLNQWTFDYTFLVPGNEDPYSHIETAPYPKLTIYKKPGAEGFEKFEEAGYTVKEYTDEWWKDIKEIQSVEISGEGVTLKKYSKGKGTVTELGWSPSNDPAQYLSREYELSAKPGDSFTLKSSFAPADAFDDRTFFVSLNEDVATVDTESGKVTVLKEGTATIRCVAASGVFSDCFIYSGSVAQTQAKTQAKSDSLKAKTPLIIISCSCAAVLVAGVVLLTIKKKRRKV